MTDLILLYSGNRHLGRLEWYVVDSVEMNKDVSWMMTKRYVCALQSKMKRVQGRLECREGGLP